MKEFFNRFLSVLAILFTWATPGFGADTKFDWKALEDEAVAIAKPLCPDRHDQSAWQRVQGSGSFSKRFWISEGIDARIIESAPGRGKSLMRDCKGRRG